MDTTHNNSRALPLQGITVVDLGQIYNGPYCTFLLAMAGARVIKIESKGGERILPGHAYLAPGHSHLLVRRTPAGFFIAPADLAGAARHRSRV